MDVALTPDLALRYLRELAADLVAAVVLTPDGRALAGPAALAGAAPELLAALAQAPIGQARGPDGVVTVARSDAHALLAVHTAHALPGLVRHDLRTVLGDLAPDGRPPADAPHASLDAASPAARAALAAAKRAAAAADTPG